MRSEDVVGVISVVNLYAVAVDCQRWELFDEVFTADAEADFGGPARWPDRASLKRDFAAIHAPFDATQHVTTNHQVVVDGDLAHCISYVVGRFLRRLPEGGGMFESGGWYDDRLLRVGGSGVRGRRLDESGRYGERGGREGPERDRAQAVFQIQRHLLLSPGYGEVWAYTTSRFY